jgi:putative membrane protein
MKTTTFLSVAVVAALIVACSNGKPKEVGQPAAGSETAAAAGTVGTAGSVPPAGAVTPDMANQDAKDFIRHLAIVNAAEMELGQLAVDRGAAAEVKEFAKTMIKDHAAAGEKLKALASNLEVAAPGELDDMHKEQREKLAKRSGPDFDREYASMMVEGHKDLIDQLEPRLDKSALEQWKVAMNGKTTAGGTIAILPDASDNQTTIRINRFAADLYPTVHAHAEAAKALESSLRKRYTTP